MSCFGNNAAVPCSRRETARHASFVAGSAVALRGSKSIVVENISAHGAKLRGHKLPPSGEQVLIWAQGLDVLGTIVWARFRECGVKFDTPLLPTALVLLDEPNEASVFAI